MTRLPLPRASSLPDSASPPSPSPAAPPCLPGPRASQTPPCTRPPALAPPTRTPTRALSFPPLTPAAGRTPRAPGRALHDCKPTGHHGIALPLSVPRGAGAPPAMLGRRGGPAPAQPPRSTRGVPVESSGSCSAFEAEDAPGRLEAQVRGPPAPHTPSVTRREGVCCAGSRREPRPPSLPREGGRGSGQRTSSFDCLRFPTLSQRCSGPGNGADAALDPGR